MQVSLDDHTGSIQCPLFSLLKLLLGSFTWWFCSLNSVHPRGRGEWEDSPFPSLLPQAPCMHTCVCIYVFIFFFTCICTKWGLGALKGQELDAGGCQQDREKNTWAGRAPDRPLPVAEESEEPTAPAGISLPVTTKFGNSFCKKSLCLKVERNGVLVSQKLMGPAEVGRKARFGLSEYEERGRVSGKEYLTTQVCFWETQSCFCSLFKRAEVLWCFFGQWGGGREDVMKKKTDGSEYLSRHC